LKPVLVNLSTRLWSIGSPRSQYMRFIERAASRSVMVSQKNVRYFFFIAVVYTRRP
jgi:hypothetical protein